VTILADRTLRAEGGEVLANGAMVPPAEEPAPRAPDPFGARVVGSPPAPTGGPLPREARRPYTSPTITVLSPDDPRVLQMRAER
jgi:hypothetical protein